MTDASQRLPLSALAILDQTSVLFRLAPHRAALALILLAGPGTAMDSGMVGADEASALNLAITILMLVLQYWIVRSFLQDLGYGLSERPRFPAFFLMGLLTSVGILVGLAVLVVPGIILMVRWSISAPVVIGSESRVIEAIGESWRATEDSFWAIFLAFTAIYAPAVVIAAVGELAIESRVASAAILNFSLNAALIVGWHVAVAIYMRLCGAETLAEIFE